MRQLFGKNLKPASEHIASQASDKAVREEIEIKTLSRVISDKKEKPAETSGIKVDKAYSDYLFNIILDEFEPIAGATSGALAPSQAGCSPSF